jgi:pyridoxamine 5'-phosphate oxidase
LISAQKGAGTIELQDCIDFANSNPVCFIATADGDQPRVRTVRMVCADESGFYYCLLSPKKVCTQLRANAKAEVCYYNNAPGITEARQMRITGLAERVDDPPLIKRAAQERAGLEQITGEPVEPNIEIWRISHGDAHFWTLAQVGKQVQQLPLEHVQF